MYCKLILNTTITPFYTTIWIEFYVKVLLGKACSIQIIDRKSTLPSASRSLGTNWKITTLSPHIRAFFGSPLETYFFLSGRSGPEMSSPSGNTAETQNGQRLHLKVLFQITTFCEGFQPFPAFGSLT